MSKPGDGFNIDKMAGGSNNLGSYFINSSQAVSWGEFQYLVVNADCVFSVLTTSANRNLMTAHTGDGSGGMNIGTNTISKGMVIVPPNNEFITAVTITSGSVLAYG